MTDYSTQSTGDKFYDEVLEDFFEEERRRTPKEMAARSKDDDIVTLTETLKK